MRTGFTRAGFVGMAAMIILPVLLSGTVLAAPTSAPTPRDATKPDKTEKNASEKFSDEWLARAAMEEVREAYSKGALEPLMGHLAEAAFARLTCGHLEQFDALTNLCLAIEYCRFLPMARGAKDEAFAQWLLDRPALARLMFRALHDVPEPEKCLESLARLVDAEAKLVQDNPNLAVAFATCVPLRHYRLPDSNSPLLDCFRWYARPMTTLRYDLKTMPYELLRFVADSRLTLAERQWAAQNYANSASPAKSYFDLRYDTDHYRKGLPKRIEKLDYTLMNLRQVGGVCIEQAYYAAQVCKSMGVPAAVVYGSAKNGIGHAWVAVIKPIPGGSGLTWDTATGRYPSMQFFTGEVYDPTDGGMLLDSELTLAGFAAQLPLPRREDAFAATLLARMVNKANGKKLTVDLESIRKLAAAYNARHAGKTDVPKVDLDCLKQERTLDASLTEDLIELAVRRNLAHRPAWALVVKLGRDGQLDVQRLDRFFSLLVDQTARHFPEYSCEMVMKIVPAIPDFSRRQKVYQRALEIYGARPDLQGRILLALADDFAQQKQPDKAYAIYEQAARRCINVPEVVMPAAAKAEAILMAQPKGQDAAIRLYASLFASTRVDRTAAMFQAATTHYQLGKKLGESLLQAGRESEARSILNKIEQQ